MRNQIWLAAAVALAIAAPSSAQTQPAAPPPVQTPLPTPSPASTLAPAGSTMQPPLGGNAPPPTPSATGLPSVPGQTTMSDSNHGVAIALLDRVQQVLDKAVDGKSGDVRVDRGLLDELRAEITQVKMTLKSEKKP